MKKSFLITVVLLAAMLTAPLAVMAEQKPEMIVEKMVIKGVRGLANTTTGIVELPKQIVLTCSEMGPLGCIFVGPAKGIGMTLYRTMIGVTEMIGFMVPAPGYYDPTIDPAYVWEGWDRCEPRGFGESAPRCQ